VAQLNRLSDWVDDIPPIEQVSFLGSFPSLCIHGDMQPMRFGNAAFRTWHKRLVDNSRILLGKVVYWHLERRTFTIAC